VLGQAPPAGPQWLRGLQPLEPHALAYDKPLCVSLDGFTLHAATRAGALDQAGTVRYAGVLASASPWRSRIAPRPPPEARAGTVESEPPRRAGGYRPWAELLARTFAVDVLACPSARGA
jgi:hypothetical protein